jgi:hypothetical protein
MDAPHLKLSSDGHLPEQAELSRDLGCWAAAVTETSRFRLLRLKSGSDGRFSCSNSNETGQILASCGLFAKIHIQRLAV